MKTYKGSLIFINILILTVFLSVYAYGQSSLLPEGLDIKEKYMPGVGPQVGRVLLVQGKAVIIHEEEEEGFWIMKGISLYKGDKIVTMPDGRVRLGMNDGSEITIASNSDFSIERSSFDRAKRRFSSFLKLSVGKARFFVKEIVDRRHPEYKVKTATAVIGVRGSDFISGVTGFVTHVTALEDTELEVFSLQYPDQPVIVTDFNQTMVVEGELPTDPTIISPEDIETMKRDFVIILDTGEEEAEEGEDEGTLVEEAGVLIPLDELVEPEGPALPEGYEEPEGPDIFAETIITNQEEDILEQEIEIGESIIEDTIDVSEELPAFPGVPE